MKRVKGMDGGDESIIMYLMPLNRTLKMVKILNAMYILSHKKLKQTANKITVIIKNVKCTMYLPTCCIFRHLFQTY